MNMLEPCWFVPSLAGSPKIAIISVYYQYICITIHDTGSISFDTILYSQMDDHSKPILLKQKIFIIPLSPVWLRDLESQSN